MQIFRSFSPAFEAGFDDAGTWRFWPLVLLSLVPVFVLPFAPAEAGIAIMGAWIGLVWVIIALARRHVDYIVLIWVAVYPYCYYYLAFPRDHPAFTVDRALIVLLVAEMLILSQQDRGKPIPREVRISAWFWGAYILTCLISLAGYPLSDTWENGSWRALIEGLIFPTLLGLYVLRWFPAERNISKLHACACILAIGLCITGSIELFTGIDLMPWNAANPQFTVTGVRRADGPFEQPGILSVVAMIAFFLIIYLGRLMAIVSPGRKLLHRIGAVAAIIAALVPLNRGLILALVPIAVIDSFSRNRLVGRRIWATMFGSMLLVIVITGILAPDLFVDRVSDPDNLIQRLTQDEETLQVVKQHPIIGLGLNMYHETTAADTKYLVRWRGIESINFQHNVIMTVLSEEGLVGLAFYFLAQYFLIRAMWRMRRAYPPGWLAFLYCFMVYVLMGLDGALVYYSDLNLIFLLALCIFLQLQISVTRHGASSCITHNLHPYIEGV